MKLFRLACLSAVLLITVSACNSSKIAFGNSYYFKQTPKHTSSVIPPVSSMQLSASTEKTVAVPPAAIIPEKLIKVAQAYEQTQQQLAQTDLPRTERKELKKEQRTYRQELRKEMKKFAAEHRVQEQQDEVTGLLKAGIIVGAAGVVMLLIGILASGAFLTTLGGIFIAVGLVLLLLRIL